MPQFKWPFRKKPEPVTETVATARLAILRAHKTGSQSFRAAMRGFYANTDRNGARFAIDVKPDVVAKRRFAAPHMTVQQWLDLAPGDDWVIAATLREPTARLRSAFSFFKGKSKVNPNGVGAVLAGMSYETFLASDHPVTKGLKDNVLTGFVGGGAFGPKRTQRNQVALPPGLDRETARDRALERLGSGLVVPLLIDEAQASVENLCRLIGVATPPQMPWINKAQTSRGRVVTDRALELEEDLLRFDREVHAAAVLALHRALPAAP